jgi:hypothetical protein
LCLKLAKARRRSLCAQRQPALILAGWRNELYQIYASPKSSFLASRPLQGAFANKAFTLERAACAIFGFATFGVHLTAYEGEGENMKLWVPRRSRTKQTFPGVLDNVSL